MVMNFNKLINISKKGKSLTIFNRKDGAQWLSNGYAIYKVADAPIFTKESLITVLPDGTKWHIETKGEEEISSINLNDYCEHDETTSEICKTLLVNDDETYMLMKGERKGIITINSIFLSPLKLNENTFFVIRSNYCVVKEGLLATAIILPIRQEFAQSMIKEIGKFTTFIDETEELEGA